MLFSKYDCVLQKNSYDCGVACLATVLKSYSKSFCYEDLYVKSRTNKFGTRLLDILNTANNMGFETKCLRADKTIFERELPLPAIAHVKKKSGEHHYLVIHKIKKDKLTIADPSLGIKNMKIEDFSKYWTGILLLMLPVEEFIDVKKNLKEKWEVISNFKSVFIVFSIVAMILGIFNSINLLVLKESIYKIKGLKIYDELFKMCIYFAFVAFFKKLLWGLKDVIKFRLISKFTQNLFENFFEKLLFKKDNAYEKEYLNSNNGYDEVKKFLNDRFEIINFILFVIVLNVLFFEEGLYLMFPFTIIYVYLSKKKLNIQALLKHRKSLLDNQLNRFIKNTKSSFRFIKYENLEELQLSELKRVLKKASDKDLSLSTKESLIKHVFHKEMFLLTMLLLFYLSTYFCSYEPTNIIFILFVFLYQENYIQEIKKINLKLNKAKYLCNSSLKSNRLNEIISKAEESSILFKDVCYKSEEIKVDIENLNFKLKDGSKLVIQVENSNAGTSILDLIMKLKCVDSGQIYIGNDKNYSTKNIGVISKDMNFVEGSIEKNLCIGIDEISKSEILEALKLTKASNFIDRLPFKLETNIDMIDKADLERNKEKLLLTRCILKDPDIIICKSKFDDMEFSKNFSFILDTLLYGNTVLIITENSAKIDNIESRISI